MNDQRITNWLLAGILALLAIQVWGQLERPVQADTLRLDDCITERVVEPPKQYLHVVAHPSHDS